jgi:hypothetical protein
MIDDKPNYDPENKYGRGKGYAELAARRVWRLLSLPNQEALFAMSDEELLASPEIGPATLKAIRKLQAEVQSE